MRLVTEDAPVGVGVIGCGFAGAELHLPALSHLPEAKVVAACDVDASRLSAVAGRFRIPVCAGDWRAVLDHPSVQAVAICVPPPSHAAVALAALDACKHVLVEKPLATSLEDCDRLMERAAESDRVVMVGFNMRWHRLVRRARAIIDAGTLGRLLLVRSVFTNGVRYERPYRSWGTSPELGGGLLTEVGVHHYDLWRYLLGSEVEEVFAMVSDAEGAGIVSARMASGVLVGAAFSEMTGGRNEIDLFGEAGQLHLSCYRVDGLEAAAIAERYPGSGRSRLRRVGRFLRDLPESLPAILRGGDYVDSYRAEWRQFFAALRHGRPATPSPLDGRRALEVALAAVQSASTGRPVAPGPATFER